MQRKAFTLVESLIAMTIGSSLMMIGIGLLHQSLSLSRRVTMHGRNELAATRLANQFRSDAYSALTVAAATENSIEFCIDQDQRIVYTIQANRIQRTFTQADGKTANEQYELASEHTPSIKYDAVTKHAELTVTGKSSIPDALAIVELRVDASTNRWSQIITSAANRASKSASDRPNAASQQTGEAK